MSRLLYDTDDSEKTVWLYCVIANRRKKSKGVKYLIQIRKVNICHSKFKC